MLAQKSVNIIISVFKLLMHNVWDELQAKQLSRTCGLSVLGVGYFLPAPALCYKIILYFELILKSGTEILLLNLSR